MQETLVQSLGKEAFLEKEMATHFNTLAWRILRTEEPGGLPTVYGFQSETLLTNTTTIIKNH